MLTFDVPPCEEAESWTRPPAEESETGDVPTWNLTVYNPHLEPVEKKAFVGDVAADQIAEKFLEGMAESEQFLFLKLLNVDTGALALYPKEEPITEPLWQVEDLLREFFAQELVLETVKLAEGILAGPHGELPEGLLLAASVYDRLGWDDMASTVFRRICARDEQPLLAITQVRLAKALLKEGGKAEEARSLLEGALSYEPLPIAQRIDGLLLLADLQEPEAALVSLGTARMLSIEHYGKVHPMTAALFALEGPLLEQTDVDSAIEVYAAAYGIYLELGDRQIFSVLESLILLYLRKGDPDQAFRDSTKAIHLIEQDPVAAPLMVTYLVLNAQALADANKEELSQAVMQRAQSLNSDEAFRIWSELQQELKRA